MQPDDFDYKLLTAMGIMGAIIGLGQLLNSVEPLSWRYVAGRAICSAALAASAPVVLLWFPTMPKIVEFAVAALVASLGTSGLVALLRRITGAPQS